MRENDAFSVTFTHWLNRSFWKWPIFQQKSRWQLLCLEFMRVETDEVIYEASEPRVHTDRTFGRGRRRGITCRVTSSRAERRQKEGHARQHEIRWTASGNRCSSRATGGCEIAIQCRSSKDAGDGEEL